MRSLSPQSPDVHQPSGDLLTHRRLLEIFAICPEAASNDRASIDLRIRLIHGLEERFPSLQSGVYRKGSVLDHCPIRINRDSFVVNIHDSLDFEVAQHYFESVLSPLPMSLVICSSKSEEVTT